MHFPATQTCVDLHFLSPIEHWHFVLLWSQENFLNGSTVEYFGCTDVDFGCKVVDFGCTVVVGGLHSKGRMYLLQSQALGSQ